MISHYIPPAHPAYTTRGHSRTAALITHIIVIVQENRTIDNLFNGFCASAGQCARTVMTDPYRGVPLVSVPMTYHNDPSHAHTAFVNDYDGGHMDGFPTPGPSDPPQKTTLAFVPLTETPQYQTMLSADGVLNDMVFAPNQGPSFPAHQYGIAGQAGGYEGPPNPDNLDISENPQGPTTCFDGGGPALAVSLATAYPGLPEQNTSSCHDHQTIFDLLPPSKTWRYYAQGDDAPLWEPTQGISHLYNSPNFITPASQVLTDIAAGSLANLTFVSPAKATSDHPNDMSDNEAGGKWVGKIVNAIGESPSFWPNTVIIVYWDDFGGWYDHVLPQFAHDPFLAPGLMNPNEYGFRVPYGLISAYANVGTVAHGVEGAVAPLYCSTSDSLAFIEHTFGLGTLNTEDILNTGCTASMENLNNPPRAFVPINVASSALRRHR